MKYESLRTKLIEIEPLKMDKYEHIEMGTRSAAYEERATRSGSRHVEMGHQKCSPWTSHQKWIPSRRDGAPEVQPMKDEPPEVDPVM